MRIVSGVRLGQSIKPSLVVAILHKNTPDIDDVYWLVCTQECKGDHWYYKIVKRYDTLTEILQRLG